MKSLFTSALSACMLASIGVASTSANQFFIAEYDNTPTLRVVDVDTGIAVSSVSLGLAFPTDLATAPNGDLYACTETALFRINKSTGAATTIGSFGFGQVVGLEFDCSGGALLVTSGGRVATVNLATGQATQLVNTGFNFSGDVATQGGGVFYASYNSGSSSRLAKITVTGGTASVLDLGFLHASKRFLGLDFDALGRLIASDNATPGNFFSIGNLSGAPTLTQLGTTTGFNLSAEIGGISSVVPSGQQIVYCPASTNSAGTVPTLAASGVASASFNSGFTLTAGNVAGKRPIALFMTNAGRANIPFGGGVFCLQSPTRAVVMQANGTLGQCNGSVSLDLNTYARGQLPGFPNPPAYLSQPGMLIQCQFVGRDAGQPLLTEALEFSICN